MARQGSAAGWSERARVATMQPRHFRRFCEIAYSRAGILLKEGKESLVAARVAKRMRALGLSSEKDYLDHLDAEGAEEELVNFLDAISTNFTGFFREPDHFTALDELVRERIAAGRRRLRIWSAASSSGEEPYTIAITVAEALEQTGCRSLDHRILATDISTRVLARARAGVYTEHALGPVDRGLRSRHFTRRVNGQRLFEVKDALKESVVFKRLNLSTPPFPMRGPLDVVFCRNVMIYFDRRVRQALVAEIERLLAPDGVLFTGHAETLAGIDTGLRAVRPSVYCRAGHPALESGGGRRK